MDTKQMGFVRNLPITTSDRKLVARMNIWCILVQRERDIENNLTPEFIALKLHGGCFFEQFKTNICKFQKILNKKS
jgi:hypothetical protein